MDQTIAICCLCLACVMICIGISGICSDLHNTKKNTKRSILTNNLNTNLIVSHQYNSEDSFEIHQSPDQTNQTDAYYTTHYQSVQ